MALLLPGERRGRLLEAALAVAAIVALCAFGCAGEARARRFPPSLIRAARYRNPAPAVTQDASAAFVVRALHRAGLKFGTDGTAGALWGYLRTSHRLVAPADARPGDIVLFDVAGMGPAPACADHVGIVESVGADGRIGFVDVRGGLVRHGFLDPQRPLLRRNEHGQVANTFLRTKRIVDPPETRYFAGQMLCAVARPKG